MICSQLLVGGALLWEIAEKLFLLRYSKRMPPVIGREALIGLPVTAVSACPDRLGEASWRAMEGTLQRGGRRRRLARR